MTEAAGGSGYPTRVPISKRKASEQPCDGGRFVVRRMGKTPLRHRRAVSRRTSNFKKAIALPRPNPPLPVISQAQFPDSPPRRLRRRPRASSRRCQRSQRFRHGQRNQLRPLWQRSPTVQFFAPSFAAPGPADHVPSARARQPRLTRGLWRATESHDRDGGGRSTEWISGQD